MIRAVLFDVYETLVTHYRAPLYFSGEIAADLGLPTEAFRPRWRALEHARSVGELTLEETLTRILAENGREDPEAVRRVAEKRRETARAAFASMRPDVTGMLMSLRERSIRIGLVSNCFSEEAEIIRESPIFPLIDAAALSYEEGVAKPEPEIFTRCLARLGVAPEEALYVGDGGSGELQAAAKLGMTALQAVWYFPDNGRDASAEESVFFQLASPEALLARL